MFIISTYSSGDSLFNNISSGIFHGDGHTYQEDETSRLWDRGIDEEGRRSGYNFSPYIRC